MRKFTSGQSGIEPTSGSAKKPAVDRTAEPSILRLA
jgi:hypothetical protein